MKRFGLITSTVIAVLTASGAFWLEGSSAIFGNNTLYVI